MSHDVAHTGQGASWAHHRAAVHTLTASAESVPSHKLNSAHQKICRLNDVQTVDKFQDKDSMSAAGHLRFTKTQLTLHS